MSVVLLHCCQLFCVVIGCGFLGISPVCEIREGQGGSDPSKSLRDPCKVVICRDPGWVP